MSELGESFEPRKSIWFPISFLAIMNYTASQVLYTSWPTVTISSTSILVVSTYLSFLVVFIWLTTRPSIAFLTTIYVTFNFLFLFLAPLAVISTRSAWFVNNASTQSEKLEAFGVLSLVLICTNFSIIISSFHFGKKPIKPNLMILAIVQYRLLIVIIVYLTSLIGLLVIAPGIVIGLLPKGLSNSQFQNPGFTLAQFGIGRALLQTTPVIIAICCLQNARQSASSSFRRCGYAFALLSFLFALPFGSSRQMFLFAAVPLTLVLFDRFRMIKQILICVIPLTVVFAQSLTFGITHSLSDIRNYGFRYLFSSSSFRVSDILVSGDFDSFAMFTLGKRALENGLFFYPFQQFLGVLFFWVPRSVWAEKPFDSAIEIARSSSFQFQNLSAPWVLELLLNGGLLLLFLGAFLLPFIFSKIDFSSNHSSRNSIHYFILSGSMFILLRGSLLQAFGVVAYALLLGNFLNRKISKLEH
jgi:hypothetical protein